jgi:hypothetical protein
MVEALGELAGKFLVEGTPKQKQSQARLPPKPRTPDRSKRVPVPGGICYYDLRALLYWACVGVRSSAGGAYQDIEEREGDPGIIRSFADQIGFVLPHKPKFRATKPQKRAKATKPGDRQPPV